MTTLTPEKKLPVFIHIPKTAGMTVAAVMSHQYFGQKGKRFTIAKLSDVDKLLGLPSEKKKKIKIIMGHLPYGIHAYLQDPTEYITFLREPTMRTLSWYNYIKTKKFHPSYKIIKKEKYSLKQVLQIGLRPNADNGQVRFLCGEQNIPYGGVNERHLEAAIENLKNNISVIGITEQFDASILLIARHFKWNTPYYLKKNIAKIEVPDVDAETEELLNYYNRYDKVLYATGLELFKQQIALQGCDFARELQEFSRENKKEKWVTRMRWSAIGLDTFVSYLLTR